MTSTSSCRFEYADSERARVCRICESEIPRGAVALVLRRCKIPGSCNERDFFFHEICFKTALARAETTRGEK